MKLTEDQAQRVISYITQTNNNRPIVCSVCGTKQWSVNNLITEMREFQNGNFILGGDSAIMPFVSLTCEHCGHTIFINAIRAGVVSPNNSKPLETNPTEDK